MTTQEPVKIDPISGHTTTGHEWDGIRELNTPLPRWWLWTFYATIIWAVGYWVVYPSWPMVNSFARGAIGYSSRASLGADLDAVKAQRDLQSAGFATASITDIAKNPAMMSIALAQGKAAFADNCMPCHGAGGAGAVNYPNLADDDWLWGGTPSQIQTTITHGIRADTDSATRNSLMRAFGRDGILSADEIAAVANHVRSIAGLAPEQGANLAAGKKVFADECAVCHGAEGKGDQSIGAPNLTDAIWLYGSDIRAITATINNPRNGVMPAWGARLDPVTVKSLALYVHSLGGGK